MELSPPPALIAASTPIGACIKATQPISLTKAFDDGTSAFTVGRSPKQPSPKAAHHIHDCRKISFREDTAERALPLGACAGNSHTLNSNCSEPKVYKNNPASPPPKTTSQKN